MDGRVWIAFFAALAVSATASQAEVLAYIAFDERHTATPEEVDDLVSVAGGEIVLWQPEHFTASPSPAATLAILSEQDFAFLAGARHLFPYPVSYFNLKGLSLELMGHPCHAWESDVDIRDCLLEVLVFSAETASAADSWAAVRDAGGINPGGEAVSPALHFVPVKGLQQLQEDSSVSRIVVAPPTEPSHLDPTPEKIYYTLLPVGEGHRFTARISLESNRVTRVNELSFAGKKFVFAREGGGFWFFERENPEITLKVLRGCEVNGHWWLFVAGVTDIGLLLQVTDEATGNNFVERTIDREPFAPILSTTAFPCE